MPWAGRGDNRMKEGEPEIRCPTCGKRSQSDSGIRTVFLPFCCERCKLIDLGKWFDEEHRIVEPLEERGGDQDGEKNC